MKVSTLCRLALTAGLFVLALPLLRSPHLHAQDLAFEPASKGIERVVVHTTLLTSWGELLVGTGAALYRFDASRSEWDPITTDHPFLELEEPLEGILMASSDRAVFRSLDRGRSWEKVFQIHGLMGFRGNHDGTIMMNDGAYGGGFIYHSIDSGTTWELYRIGSSISYRSGTIELGNRIFFGTIYKGVIASTDRGENWERIPGLDETIHSFIRTPNGSLVAACGFSILNTPRLYESTDSGKTWALVDSLDAGLVLEPGSGDDYFVTAQFRSTTEDQSHFGLYRRTVGDSTPQLLRSGPGTYRMNSAEDGDLYVSENHHLTRYRSPSFEREEMTANLRDYPVNAIVTAPDGTVYTFVPEETLYGSYRNNTSYGLYRSTNSGDSWTAVSSGFSGPTIDGFSPNGGTAYLFNSPRLHIDRFGNLYADRVSHAWDFDNPPLSLYFKAHAAISSDGGTTWKQISGSQINNVQQSESGLILVTTSFLQSSLFSRDSGRSWQRITSVTGDGWNESMFSRVEHIELLSDNRVFVRSRVQSLNDPSIDSIRIIDLDASPVTVEGVRSQIYSNVIVVNNNILVGTTRDGIVRSSDWGRHWDTIPFTTDIGRVYEVTPGLLWGYNRYRLRYFSEDGGRTWIKRNDEHLPGAGALRFADHYYTIENDTYLRSIDGGRSWLPLGRSDNIEESVITIDSTGTFIVGTRWQGIWRSQNVTSVLEDGERHRSGIQLDLSAYRWPWE